METFQDIADRYNVKDSGGRSMLVVAGGFGAICVALVTWLLLVMFRPAAMPPIESAQAWASEQRRAGVEIVATGCAGWFGGHATCSFVLNGRPLSLDCNDAASCWTPRPPSPTAVSTPVVIGGSL